MLGEQKAMDVPFSVIGYASETDSGPAGRKLYRRRDPVMTPALQKASAEGYGNFAETYRIHGFKLDGDDMTMERPGGRGAARVR